MIDDEGTAEDKAEFKDAQGVVSRWKQEIELAKDTEKDWRKSVDVAICTYRSDEKITGNGSEDSLQKPNRAFNILYANIETKRPALYNSLPRPDIRRRFRDKDRLGKAISELLERAVTYTVDTADMDYTNKAAVNDMLVAGRAVTRVKYITTMTDAVEAVEATDEVEGVEAVEEEVSTQEVQFQQWQWKDFNRGPGCSWDEVPWIAYDHRMTKDEVTEQWGEDVAKKLTYSLTSVDNDTDDDDDESNASIFKRVLIHEIWDKDAREVIWISPDHSDGPLATDEDPLSLKGFFDIPRPLYAIESSTSLIPITEYSHYIFLATNLEDITRRITKITSALRVRGIYDSSIAELGKLFDSDDNQYVPAEDLSRLIEAGGLEKAIWTIPIQQIAETLAILRAQRPEITKEIYELTGISDIQRGASNPHETKGAQEIKATFGGQRLKRQQEDVQRYLRDLIRIAVEVIGENFSRETLTAMTGLNFPTEEEKNQAKQMLAQAQQYQQMAQQHQQRAQQAQQQGIPPQMMGPPLPPPPDKKMLQQANSIMQKVTWEQIEEAMGSDLTREYRIDVETDSTIQDELQQDQKDKRELLTSIGQLLQTAPQALQMGVLDQPTLKEILLDTVRGAKMGRGVEDAIENMRPPQKKKGPSPEQIQQQQEQKAQEMQNQHDAKMLQMEEQAATRELQMEEQSKLKEAQMENQKLQLEQKYMRLEFDYKLKEHELKMAQMERKDISDEKKHRREVEKYNMTGGELKRAS